MIKKNVKNQDEIQKENNRDEIDKNEDSFFSFYKIFFNSYMIRIDSPCQGGGWRWAIGIKFRNSIFNYF